MKKRLPLFIIAAVTAVSAFALPVQAEDELMYEDLNYEIAEDGHVVITNCYQSAEECVIPSEIDGKAVTEIADSAFSECYFLKKVVIPDSVKAIGRQAFSACSVLEEVDMPAELEAIDAGIFDACPELKTITMPAGFTELPEATFYECSGLTSVTLSEGIEVIGSEAFYGCTSLTEVNLPESLTSIDEYAFEDCSSLQTIEFPANTVNLGGYIFQDCSSLVNIKVAEGNEMFADRDGILFTADGNTLVRYPEAREDSFYTVPDGCTQLANGSFLDAVNLTGIDLNQAVTYGMDVFFRCTGLKEITFPEGTVDIAPYMLGYCSSLEKINLPSTLKTIGDYSIYTCASLTELTVPEGVTTIGNYSFFNCIALKDLTLPDTVTSIGDGAIGYYAEADDAEPEKVPGFTLHYGDNKTIYDFAKQYDLETTGTYSGVIWRWVLIIGGILLVIAVIVLIIVLRRRAMQIRPVPGGRKGSETKRQETGKKGTKK